MRTFDRITIVLAGLLGASGVAAAAASSHAGAELLGPYALVALTHAPALLALGLVRPPKLFDTGTTLLMAGAVLFCADLATRHFLGHGLFPMSAPLGGATLIIGWLALGIAALLGRDG